MSRLFAATAVRLHTEADNSKVTLSERREERERRATASDRASSSRCMQRTIFFCRFLKPRTARNWDAKRGAQVVLCACPRGLQEGMCKTCSDGL